jgi:hypothetical protein
MPTRATSDARAGVKREKKTADGVVVDGADGAAAAAGVIAETTASVSASTRAASKKVD